MAKFCQNCGNEVDEKAVICVKCGVSLQGSQPANNNVGGVELKSKIAAGLLGIFLGALGIHNFYLGYKGKAVAQLLISVLSCGILSPISATWGLIEGILVLTGSIKVDGNGNQLRD